ncbi:glucose-1-phosphate cytidylyltransferase [Thiocapsa rosea]|uniref:Glucose-1-phosphate cytidylyltransferase n=1 Tax=Thiocapsa rosea TaxID=69360 RepID=A0A495VGA9_9GAMM|nr:glucose-1-phosphate cytidylyltransferase [Thiocapsa rosea]RKT47477.1 glucose-1-phosphate cytidylyltransferase [Thiocapsa rosea]
MKAVILAGGLGTRLSEETVSRPKPMVEIGGRPILWHIMKIFSAHGINEFVICCGYRGYMIKEYFANYVLHAADVTIDINKNQVNFHSNAAEPWKVTLVDTGALTGTGGRLKRVADHIGSDTFCMTYGDGVGNIAIDQLIEFHKNEGTLATLTAVQPPGRFGAFKLSPNSTRISRFREKPKGDGAWVNGGFFVLEPKVLDYISGDETYWEIEPLAQLSEDGELTAYRHEGFWYAMDTLRDRNILDEHWNSGNAPWKMW